MAKNERKYYTKDGGIASGTITCTSAANNNQTTTILTSPTDGCKVSAINAVYLDANQDGAIENSYEPGASISSANEDHNVQVLIDDGAGNETVIYHKELVNGSVTPNDILGDSKLEAMVDANGNKYFNLPQGYILKARIRNTGSTGSKTYRIAAYYEPFA
jgi:hypothetical protein